MKNKILTLFTCTTCIGCLVASVIIASKPAETVVKEDVVLEEFADQPTWSVLYKDNEEFIKKYQEAYSVAYQKYFDMYLEYYRNNPSALTNPNSLKNGKNGVGIQNVALNDDGDLIVTLTNGESQNAGSIKALVEEVVSDSTIPTKEYEKIGYVLKGSGDLNKKYVMIPLEQPDSNYYPIIFEMLSDYDYSKTTLVLNSCEVELTKINNSNPSQKYEYTATLNYTIQYGDFIPVTIPTNYYYDEFYWKGTIFSQKLNSLPSFTLDSTRNIGFDIINDTENGTYEVYERFSSDTPYVSISSFDEPRFGFVENISCSNSPF